MQPLQPALHPALPQLRGQWGGQRCLHHWGCKPLQERGMCGHSCNSGGVGGAPGALASALHSKSSSRSPEARSWRSRQCGLGCTCRVAGAGAGALKPWRFQRPPRRRTRGRRRGGRQCKSNSAEVRSLKICIRLWCKPALNRYREESTRNPQIRKVRKFP